MVKYRHRKILYEAGLYVITDIQMAKGRSYPEIVLQALRGGARIIQLRDKTTPLKELIEIGKRLKNLTAEYNALFIVNDNPYLAQAIGADGVHLGQMDMPVDIAREIVGENKIIGLSTHNFRQITNAVKQGEVDYIAIGPIFPTNTKKQEYPPLGVEVLRWAATNLSLPFVAIGGINKHNIAEVVEAGARLVAVISAVMQAPDITQATQELCEIIYERAR